MLDAAHGEGIGAVGVVQRIHAALDEVQVARSVRVRAAESRRRPTVAFRADIAQGSVLTEAEARSRHECSNRWNGCRKERSC